MHMCVHMNKRERDRRVDELGHIAQRTIQTIRNIYCIINKGTKGEG